MVDRHFGLSPVSEDLFTDDKGSGHEAAIDALAAAGMITGNEPGIFAPEATVSREEMAPFMGAFGL